MSTCDAFHRDRNLFFPLPRPLALVRALQEKQVQCSRVPGYNPMLGVYSVCGDRGCKSAGLAHGAGSLPERMAGLAENGGQENAPAPGDARGCGMRGGSLNGSRGTPPRSRNPPHGRTAWSSHLCARLTFWSGIEYCCPAGWVACAPSPIVSLRTAQISPK